MRTALLPLLLVFLAACDGPASPPVPGRWYAEEQVARGETLYRTHCTSCHGDDGSATDDWRTPDADGHYPPPPLNGTAHTWHHPLDVLDDTIREGGAPFGGLMPAFGSELDKSDRAAVIAYIQSWWPEAVYRQWQEIDARSR